MLDSKFKDHYSDSIYEGIFTFPKFTRNFSKNYKKVQASFKKEVVCKKLINFT